jgi:hypothetical protein
MKTFGRWAVKPLKKGKMRHYQELFGKWNCFIDEQRSGALVCADKLCKIN